MVPACLGQRSIKSDKEAGQMYMVDGGVRVPRRNDDIHSEVFGDAFDDLSPLRVGQVFAWG